MNEEKKTKQKCKREMMLNEKKQAAARKGRLKRREEREGERGGLLY
jgi:hypothetical protein